MEVVQVPKRRWVGREIKRKEDLRFLTGGGSFVYNLNFPEMLHVAILRSHFPHAKIKRIDTSGALAQPGVRAVLTGEDVAAMMDPFPHLIPTPKYYPIAIGKTRYVGEPVALVAAQDRSSARDALEFIDVAYDSLPPVVNAEKAMQSSSPLLHEDFGTNVGWHREFHYGDADEAFDRAEIVERDRFYFHRFASTPIEPWATVAAYNSVENKLTIWDQNQQAPMYRSRLSRVLRIPEQNIRLITPDIGGGFGNKQTGYGYSALIALVAIRTAKPVKWVADRREDLMGLMHSPDRIVYVEGAAKSDGEVLGLRFKLIDNFGAYLRHPEPQNITNPFKIFLGCYRIKNAYIDAYGVMTNKCPTGPNRGYGINHTYFQLERMMDRLAQRLGIDPAEIRLRNFIRPQEMPYTTPFGCVYDGGDYPAALTKALEMIRYRELREEQGRLWKEGKYIGIGVSSIVEPGATNASVAGLWGSTAPYASTDEAATVKVHATGKVTVAMGTVPQGQGHETVASQIVADELGVPVNDIDVLRGFDTATHPYGGNSGTYASRFSQVAVGALVGACRKIREKMMRIAAHRLGAKPEELDLADGKIFVRESPERPVTVREIARAAYHLLALLPPGVEPGLEATYTYMFPYTAPLDSKQRSNFACSYGNSAVAAAVEVDVETGEVKILRYVAVHDCGIILNPLLLRGQIHGAVAHGIGGALYEEFAYDEDGQLLATTFADYLVPTAVEIPEIEIEHMVSPSPFTALGAKGAGEGGSMPAPAIIASAVEDALKPLGVKINSLPLTPSRVWELIQRSKAN